MLDEKKERKRAAISAARHENKPTEKSALMSRMHAAGCVGWILPHPPKRRIILQVQAQIYSQVYILLIITLNSVLFSSVQHREIFLRKKRRRETINRFSMQRFSMPAF
jgi:hypothetical protein